MALIKGLFFSGAGGCCPENDKTTVKNGPDLEEFCAYVEKTQNVLTRYDNPPIK